MGRKPGKFVQIVAGDKYCDLTLPVQAQDQLPHLYDSLGIKSVGGLVQNKEIRVPRQRHCNAQSLAHPQGKVFCSLFPCIAQSYKLKYFRDAVVRGQT